jgi:ribosome-associated translation inhibitor RaiA
MNEKTHLSVLHFEVSPSTQDAIRRDLARLYRQEAPVTRLDVSLEGEYQNHTRISYHVTLRAQLRDEVLFEMKQGPQLLPTVQAAADALERRLRLPTPASTL